MELADNIDLIFLHMVKFIKKGFEGSARHKKRRARVKGSSENKNEHRTRNIEI
jgi:hypothetical protein